ncbi:sigma factor-like helix-turn-helix DNA-binding protein [Actinomadura opuntiae]|uniref:sigma factor-like helix-turn-helix DNA-binding protein n=1 Tax=Actinomadura sp. OS1-43 TaxID=604315 RepID=UPI00255A7558|nr:sigma factor-like helix-turn-helix DNA-binding protein [Actinomadura sp. OS1-43]MDL4816100.1 sigma factor-like helix-turn-helix DNA-binding protein [Actinomadura sp. OS1-43]
MATRMGKHTGSFAPGGPGERTPSAAVARAFQALPPAHREILTETVFRERSVNEAAAQLGVPVDVVKVRVYRALRALHATLGAPVTR